MRAGGAGEEKLLVIAQCPMPNAPFKCAAIRSER